VLVGLLATANPLLAILTFIMPNQEQRLHIKRFSL